MILERFKHVLSETRGMTLIELIVSLSITVVVLAAIGTFFVSNFLSFYQAKNAEVLLHEISSVTKAIEDVARASKKVVAVKRVGNEYQGITFLNSDGSHSVFLLTGTQITQKDGAKAPLVLTSLATSFSVLPVQTTGVVIAPNYTNDTNNSFTAIQTRGIEYHITLKEGDETQTVTSQISFRNKE